MQPSRTFGLSSIYHISPALPPSSSYHSLNMKNPAYFLHSPGIARIGDSLRPEIEDPNDVIIRIAYVGVCGSDVSLVLPKTQKGYSKLQVHFWTHGAIGANIIREPLIMGHEASGTVHEVGGEVKFLKVGDRVAIEPGKY